MKPLVAFLVALLVALFSVGTVQGQTPTPDASSNQTMYVYELNTTVADPLQNLTVAGRAMLATVSGVKFLSLTPVLANARGAIRLAVPSVYFPTISFRMFIGGGTGGQGLAFSYGGNIPSNLTMAINTSVPAYGYGDNLVISFKSVTDNVTQRGVNIHFNGARSQPSLVIPVGIRRAAWVDVQIVIAPAGAVLDDDSANPISAYLSLAVDNSWLLVNQTMYNWAPDDSWCYLFSASSNSLTDNHRVDSLKVALDGAAATTITVTFSTGDLTNPPLTTYSNVTLNAAILTARGSPAAIKVVRTALRTSASPKGRRHLNQESPDNVTVVFVTLSFQQATYGSALETAYKVVQGISTGAFAVTSSTLFATSGVTWGAGGPPDLLSAWYPPVLQDYVAAQRTLTSQVCTVATERTVFSLVCPIGQAVTAVTFASYGLPNGTCLSGFTADPKCDLNTTDAVVNTACLGKKACTFNANGTFLGGDPCPGFKKRLAVFALCSAQCTAKSLVNVVPARFRFYNNMTQQVRLKWCDSAYNPEPMCELPRKQSCTIHTYESHAYTVVDAATNAVITSFVVAPDVYDRWIALKGDGTIRVQYTPFIPRKPSPIRSPVPRPIL